MSGGQFDWGGRLIKVEEAFKGSFDLDGNQMNECKRINEPDCETDGSSRDERSELVIRWYVSGNAIAQRIKVTLSFTKRFPPAIIYSVENIAGHTRGPAQAGNAPEQDRSWGSNLIDHHAAAQRARHHLKAGGAGPGITPGSAFPLRKGIRECGLAFVVQVADYYDVAVTICWAAVPSAAARPSTWTTCPRATPPPAAASTEAVSAHNVQKIDPKFVGYPLR